MKLIALLSIFLFGCGGGSNNDELASCKTISGGTTQVAFTSGCATCRAANLPAAIDGNKSSAATMTLDVGSGGTVAIRATAQPGIIYPAGTFAGLIYGQRSSGSQASQTYMVRTYLNGVLTGDSGSVGPINGVGSGGDSSPQSSNIGTRQQFDAVEFVYSQGTSSAALNIDVYEFCTE